MEVDYKLVLSIIAICISLYSVWGNRRISALEKKTEIMSELDEIRSLIFKTYREFDNLVRVKDVMPKEFNEAVNEGVIALNFFHDQLEAASSTMLVQKKISKVKLEENRPMVKRMIRDAQKLLDDSIAMNNRALKLCKQGK